MDLPDDQIGSSFFLFVYENALSLALGLAAVSVLLIGVSIFFVVRRNGILEEQRRRKTYLETAPVEQP